MMVLFMPLFPLLVCFIIKSFIFMYGVRLCKYVPVSVNNDITSIHMMVLCLAHGCDQCTARNTGVGLLKISI